MESDVQRGLARHFEAFSARPGRLGYKVAFNPPAVQARLGLSGSLVAGIGEGGRLPDGGAVSIGAMRAPVLEAEVVARLGSDLPAGASDGQVAAAVEAIGPAIELVDFDRPLDALEEVLAEGVYHRNVVFGPLAAPPAGASLAGLPVRVLVDGTPVFEGDAEQATGTLTQVLAHSAGVLARFGQTLRAGDHMILGSMAPPVPARPGGRFALELGAYGSVSLALRD